MYIGTVEFCGFCSRRKYTPSVMFFDNGLSTLFGEGNRTSNFICRNGELIIGNKLWGYVLSENTIVSKEGLQYKLDKNIKFTGKKPVKPGGLLEGC